MCTLNYCIHFLQKIILVESTIHQIKIIFQLLLTYKTLKHLRCVPRKMFGHTVKIIPQWRHPRLYRSVEIKLHRWNCLLRLMVISGTDGGSDNCFWRLCLGFLLYTEKTIFPFPFTMNGIWSWWRILNQIDIPFVSKSVTAIISHSLWKEMEISFSWVKWVSLCLICCN